MKVMLQKISLFLFLILLAKGSMTAFAYSASASTNPTPVPIQNTRCLYLGGFLDQLFVQAQQQKNSTWKFYANVTQINKKLNISSHLIMNPFLFADYPYELASDQYAKFINNLPLKTVWSRGALRASDGNFTCEYMTNFMKSLQRKIKIQLGVIGDATSWRNFYPNGCQTMSIFPLLYDGFSSGWAKFGGWSDYDLRKNWDQRFDMCFQFDLFKIEKK